MKNFKHNLELVAIKFVFIEVLKIKHKELKILAFQRQSH